MEHHEAVYEQIIEVSSANQGADFLSHHLVQEIVVPQEVEEEEEEDNNQESNCEIAGMEMMLPSDCITVQDSNLVISCSTDGIDKQTGHLILQESTRVELVSHVNNIGSNTNYTENHKEVKAEQQQYVLQDQTTLNQEAYQVADPVLVTTASSDEATITATPNHTPLDNYKVISSNQGHAINNAEMAECTKDQDIKMQVDGGTVVVQDQVVDAHVCNKESPIDPQIHSTNENDHEKNVKTVNHDNSTTMETEQQHLASCMELAQNNETGGETRVLVNSDDIAVMAEFNTIEYSTEEEIGALQEAGPKSEPVTEGDQPEEQNNVQQELVKNELGVNNVEIEANADEIVESKLEANSNQIGYNNQSSQEEEEEEEDEIDLHLSTQSTDSHRKVIQDIFDDWQDENCEEENNQSSDALKDHHQDSVEKELQNLLNDDAQQVQTVSSTNAAETCSVSESQRSLGKSRTGKVDKASLHNKSPAESSPAKSSRSSSSGGKSLKGAREQEDVKKVQPRPGVKVPGSHLTSPIASTAEVAEALSKRLREKQKDLVVPKTADIVFVKKISQRLSNQLSQVVASMPPSVPLQPTLATASAAAAAEVDKNKSIEGGATSKASSVSDNNDLLAILEGDADPEWSNLKSEKTSNSNSTSSSTGKLDPATERELALKQLLELPNITPKKNTAAAAAASPASAAAAATHKKPKKTKEKEPTAKASKEQARSKVVKEESSTSTQDPENSSLDSTEEVSPTKAKKSHSEVEDQSSSAEIQVGVHDESRSGRKRKLTEKAREHELAVKRQKVFKSKSTESTKQKVDAKSVEKVTADSESTSQDKPIKTEVNQVKTDSKTGSPEPKPTAKAKVVPLKRSKLGLLKKNASISKKKLAVKNLLRQRAASKNAVTAAKSAKPNPKKTDDASGTPEKTTTPAAHKGKKVSEIDRLLQDEGVVNLLYDVEQPDSRKRLVPITKSQKKVMDVEKAERELKLRTKLVKNAVLRLRNSASATVKISPRSRRSAASEQSSPQQPAAERRSNDATKKAQQQQSSESADFVTPAKIRNAADASRIIRRHSSSSFSSASASPRVSIDVPAESIKLDELEAKRKLSHDSTDAADAKKSKKKAASKSEQEDDYTRSPSRKATRSSAAAAATATTTTTTTTTTPPKAIPKSKKVPKSRSSSDALWTDVKGGPPLPPPPPSRDQDELSACLAEAASALQSSINGSSRSSSSSARKKGNSKVQSDDDKLDSKKFSNKEINVRRHGHLVQLILTPSAPVSGIRNAITIPVMNEVREALAILADDDDCRVVLFTSTGTSFCEGLELSYLQQPTNKEERKIRAEEMANAVRDFVRALAAFNKPIVAGVQGAATGLGVTMLPLFDLVIASDKATFSTPYGKLGQIAEGAAVLTLSHSLGSAVTNELLLGGRTLTASEALRAGLVTRVLWPDRFQGELLPSLKVMSEQSAQAMEATKALLRHELRKKLDAALESESFLLVQHWCSQECQEAIKAYIEDKGQ